MLSVGSLFSGIGGFDLGLERAGMRTAWFCENDEFCQRVLAKHWPGIVCHPDITELVEPEPVDVLCGGFPCQDISLAGAGAGIDGARSGLWSEYARLVGELRPRYVVVENVPALLARGLGRVLGDLAALGYDAEWDCLPASAFGAPHRRDRIWLVAYPEREPLRQQPTGLAWRDVEAIVGHDGGEEPLADADQERRHGRSGQLGRERGPESANGGSALADADIERCGEGLQRASGRSERPGKTDALGFRERELQDANGESLDAWRVGGRVAQAGGAEWWAVEPPVGRVAHGVPNRLDQLAALGNALVPQIAEWIGRRIVSYEEALNA